MHLFDMTSGDETPNLRCSEPGEIVAVAVVASRAPGR